MSDENTANFLQDEETGKKGNELCDRCLAPTTLDIRQAFG